MSYVIFDLETSIRASFKRKGNPFDASNFVVMSGFKRKGGSIVGEWFGREPKPADWFTKLLHGTKLLVGLNIKYDILYVLQDPEHGAANLAAWMEYVANGGNVWDGQLAEYLLNGMAPSEHMLSMDEMAPRYGGNVKFDEVKALWEAGVSTEDIDPGLVRRYLCGTRSTIILNGEPVEVGDHGDIGNTEIIFLGQLERARACGQMKSILMNMGSLCCTIEMERNGMAVDKELGIEQAAELATQIATLSTELAAYIPADCPFDFNWMSGMQKSAIIFGGTVKYEKRMPTLDDLGCQVYTQMKVEHVKLVEGDYMPLADWHADPEAPPAERFKGGKNAGEVKTKQIMVDDLDKPKSAMRDFFYTFPRVTEPSSRWAGAKDGVWSTSGEVIEALGTRDIPFLKSLSKVAGLTKDLTTYYIVTDDAGVSTGMLTLVQADGIIHHMLNHTSTVTARFSSSNPNLQNLPLGGKSKVKTLFVSRFTIAYCMVHGIPYADGGVIIQSDFKSLEVYVQAIITSCAQLIKDLKAGLDMHCVRVSQTHGITYEEAIRLCVAEHVVEWSQRRTDAKVFSFQRAYGAGAKTIAENTGIALDVVETLIEAEKARYPEIEPFFEALTAQIKATSSQTNVHFNHPDIVGLPCNPRKGYYRTPDNKLYTWRENAAPEWMAKRPASKGGAATSFSPTEIKNYPVQGTGGEWAKAAMWLAIRVYYKMKNWKGLALLVNQVHDALYADAAKQVALEAAAALHAAMEEASVFMEWYFDWKIPVPVPTDTEWGPNMLDHSKMPEGFKARVTVWRSSIRKMFINNYQPSFEAEQRKAA